MSQVEVVAGVKPEEEIELLEVFVTAGTEVAQNDVLAEVATDKANLEVVAPCSGRVVDVRVRIGEVLAGDTPLFVIERS